MRLPVTVVVVGITFRAHVRRDTENFPTGISVRSDLVFFRLNSRRLPNPAAGEPLRFFIRLYRFKLITRLKNVFVSAIVVPLLTGVPLRVHRSGEFTDGVHFPNVSTRRSREINTVA